MNNTKDKPKDWLTETSLATQNYYIENWIRVYKTCPDSREAALFLIGRINPALAELLKDE